jgi:hypothetical protein
MNQKLKINKMKKLESFQTASEFIKSKLGLNSEITIFNVNLDLPQIISLMNEYSVQKSKFHVTAALQSALQNVTTDMNKEDKNNLPNPHFKVIEDSIINAYPVTIIK